MSGEQFDDPNRECVGLPPCWVEGAPGRKADADAESPENGDGDGLDALTKDELLDLADERGVEGVTTAMTKAEIRDAIEAEEGEDES